MKRLVALLALSACAPILREDTKLAPSRIFVVDADFSDAERESITSAIDEWNVLEVIRPVLAYAPVDTHPSVITSAPAGTVLIQRGYPTSGEDDVSTWANAGETFWTNGAATAAIFIQIPDRRVILHELGHSFGLGHVADTSRIMNPDVTNTQHVSPKDYAALCEIWRCGVPDGD